MQKTTAEARHKAKVNKHKARRSELSLWKTTAEARHKAKVKHIARRSEPSLWECSNAKARLMTALVRRNPR